MKYDTINVTASSGVRVVGAAFDEALKLADRRGIEEVTRVSLYATEAEEVGGRKHIISWDIDVEGRVALGVDPE